jgi:hypothetical protein
MMNKDVLLPTRYLTAVLGRDLETLGGVRPPSADWRQWFLDELTEFGWEISSDGCVTAEGKRYGELSFHSVQEIQEVYSDCPLLTQTHPCPWVTGTLGFVTWETIHFGPFYHAIEFPQAIVRVCWGRTVRLRDESMRDPLVLLEYPLIDCRWMYGGFQRSERLLSLDSSFLASVAEEVNSTLGRIGIETVVEPMDKEMIEESGYTPIQFVIDEDEPLVDLRGRSEDELERILRTEYVKVWGFDPSLFDMANIYWWLY